MSTRIPYWMKSPFHWAIFLAVLVHFSGAIGIAFFSPSFFVPFTPVNLFLMLLLLILHEQPINVRFVQAFLMAVVVGMTTEMIGVNTGMLFGNNPLLLLSLSPHGMEDIPSYMKKEIEQYGNNRNFTKIMTVDCHNAMGEEISKEDGEDMLKAAKSCLDSLITKESFPIELGYANTNNMDVWTEDLAKGGLGMTCLKINNKKYFLGWADANNMENGIREKIIEKFSNEGYNLLEICTSDTHYAAVKARNRNGYYQLGLITSGDKLSNWFIEIAKKAQSNIKLAKYEILENETELKVMGQSIYEDYSKALENSLKITKIFVIGSLGLFITSLFL